MANLIHNLVFKVIIRIYIIDANDEFVSTMDKSGFPISLLTQYLEPPSSLPGIFILILILILILIYIYIYIFICLLQKYLLGEYI